jgi:putative membrane protein
MQNNIPFLIRIIISSLAVMITAWLLPGVHVEDYLTGILVALVLALLNAFLKPLLVIFTLPATLFTFGLFLFVINAVIILIADTLVSGLSVGGFWWAMLFSVVLTLITSILQSLGTKRRNNPNQDFHV